MKKVVTIVGPTAIGKTDLAFEIANDYNGELVSADSVQVYKGLDTISGKDIPEGYKFFSLPQFSTLELYAGYYTNSSFPPIYLLDVVEPTFEFTVSHFHSLATKIVDFVEKKGKLPIIVGGTGLYINSLIGGLDQLPPPDLKLRKMLENENLERLQELVPAEVLNKMNNSDRNNSRRLIRAIEVSKSKIVKNIEKPDFEYLVLGLNCDREALKKRIDQRVEKRLQNGAIDEINKLFKIYDQLSPQVKDANGYRQLFAYLKGDSSLSEATERWKLSEYKHAKNQMTWFNKYGEVNWFDILDKDYKVRVKEKINKFLG